MKQENCAHCPGCSRHCPAYAVRCKYGQKYFEKHPPESPAPCSKKHKWEKHVTSGGLVWQLIAGSRNVKKALCREQITEETLLRQLTPEEQEALSRLLTRLSEPISSR